MGAHHTAVLAAASGRRPSSLLVALLLLGLCAPVEAGDPTPPSPASDRLPLRHGQEITHQRLTLDTITASELTYGMGSTTHDLGTWRPGRTPSQQPPLRTRVTRSIPELWRLRLSDFDAGRSLDVQYEVVGASGHRGHLTNVDHPEAEIGVVLEPLPSRVVHRDQDGVVVEGGVVLQVAIDETRFAGTYTGSVIVTVSSP